MAGDNSGETPAAGNSGAPEVRAEHRETGDLAPKERRRRNKRNPRGGGNGRQRKNRGGGQGSNKRAARLNLDVTIPPVVPNTSVKRRHRGILLSFICAVMLPIAVIAFYVLAVAEDRFGSTAGFTVRSQEGAAATDLLGGLASFTGTSTASDSDILYEFIQSQEMVDAVDKRLGLRAHFNAHWPQDWAFALWPDASREDMLWYWKRIVKISIDSASGLIEVTALAYDPQTAQDITQAILDESQTRINVLNVQAREDAMYYAHSDLSEAVERLKAAREAFVQFRTRTRIVDPEADIQGRMGVMNNLQQQLAETLIEFDLLRGTVPETDPRVRKALQRIEVIRSRIDIEREAFAVGGDTDVGAVAEDYPTLISEFERLTVDRVFAEEAYRAALAAVEVARADATRQSRYLAVYIRPNLAEDARYPNGPVLIGLSALFLLLSWSILVLVYYSLRDRQ